MLREKCSSASPLRTANNVDVDVFTEYSGAPVEMFSLNATVGHSPPFDGKRVGKFAWGNFARSQPLHISTSDQRRYIAASPKPYRRNPRLRNVFTERCGGVIRRHAAKMGGDFGPSKITTTTHQHLPSRAVHRSHSTIHHNECHPSWKYFH